MTEARTGRRWGIWIVRALAAAAVVIGLLALGRAGGPYVRDFLVWVEGMGVIAPAIYVAGYAVATVAFVPGSLLSLAGGAIFGLGWGLLYAMVGATMGSVGAFLASRYVARGWVQRRVAGDARFEALDRNVGQHGLKLVFLLRMTPVMPFNLMNYALGLTRIRAIHFVVAHIAMLPGALLYVYSGWLAGDIAVAVGEGAVERGPGYYALVVLGLVATAILTVVITRIAREALREEVSDEAIVEGAASDPAEGPGEASGPVEEAGGRGASGPAIQAHDTEGGP